MTWRTTTTTTTTKSNEISLLWVHPQQLNLRNLWNSDYLRSTGTSAPVSALLLFVATSPYSNNDSNNNTIDDHADDDDDRIMVDDIEKLIVSLSYEANDEKRRNAVAAILDEQLSPVRNDKFVTLFEQVLVRVGDRVRTEALNKIGNQSPPTTTVDQDVVVGPLPSSSVAKTRVTTTTGTDGTELTTVNKQSTDVQQVWALIDMMIQSKVIIKKAESKLK
jgi:hypothetical protein